MDKDTMNYIAAEVERLEKQISDNHKHIAELEHREALVENELHDLKRTID